tara:strand:+ start:46 stop:378 length:333 start_codon:yes stop_codon:yes gene_type:complete
VANNGYYPYFTGIADKQFSPSLNTDGQIRKYKEDEAKQKAPPILPYELQQIEQLLGDTFVSLAELRGMLDVASSRSGIDSSTLDSINQKIDQINKILTLEIPEDLSKIGI